MPISAHQQLKIFAASTIVITLVGCSTFKESDGYPSAPPDVSQVQNAVPKPEPKSRYGNPDSYTVFGKRYHVMKTAAGYKDRGYASWYGTKFHGQRTSSGETYDMYQMTAAHKTLPLPTYARVTNLDNGESVIVKINDRGPFHPGRIVDLSYSAAYKLGILQKGTGHVEVEALTPGFEAKDLIIAKNEPQLKQPTLVKATSKDIPDFRPIEVSQEPNILLQVGAFSNELRAQELQNKLKQSGHQARITQHKNNTLPVYKVQVMVDDKSKIDHLSQKLAALTQATPLLVLQ